MVDQPFNVLFLCTGNSARSIFAECLVNHLGQGRFRGYSAGSHPKGEVHPLTIRELQRNGLPTDGLRSKDMAEFERLMPRRWISSSPSVTRRPRKSVRSGRAIR